MLFNSLQFVFFYVVITLLYWFMSHKKRWFLLLMGSCYFYMVFAPKYILILGFTILIDYAAGIYLEKVTNKRKKRLLLTGSLVANIGVLAIFKYYNFFNHILDDFLAGFSGGTPFSYLQILLPIGLSFHTFQAMSYTIEVYRGHHKAEKHFGIYALYVMFYPQLVAGPIERPQNMLWQFHTPARYDFENLKSGLIQMAFGMFKKVVIADRLGQIVDHVYATSGTQNGKTVWIGVILYSFQIYCDFSGYSDIGIGAARTMGFNLMKNFDRPYESRSVSAFWSRWHISLSSWFRDYLYIPLGGNRVALSRKYLNIAIVFLVSGLWHGANWTFIIWGALHGLLVIVESIKISFLRRFDLVVTEHFISRMLETIVTFLLVSLAWVFFRSPDLQTAISLFKKLFSVSFDQPLLLGNNNPAALLFSFLLIMLLMIKEKYFLVIPTNNTVLFYVVFITLTILCYLFGIFGYNRFIYFQF